MIVKLSWSCEAFTGRCWSHVRFKGQKELRICTFHLTIEMAFRNVEIQLAIVLSWKLEEDDAFLRTAITLSTTKT